jgi:hypothetical protein
LEDSQALKLFCQYLASRSSAEINNADVISYPHWCLVPKGSYNTFKNTQIITSVHWSNQIKFVDLCTSLGLFIIQGSKKKYPLPSKTPRFLINSASPSLKDSEQPIHQPFISPYSSETTNPQSYSIKKQASQNQQDNSFSLAIKPSTLRKSHQLQDYDFDDINEFDQKLLQETEEVYTKMKDKAQKGNAGLKIITKEVA